MGEIATGYGSQGSNPSGVGAYIFSPTVDPLTVHLHNLGEFEQNMRERRAEQREKIKVGAAAISDLDPKVEGIMDTDAQYFQEQGLQLRDLKAKMYGAGLDYTNPMFTDAYTKAQYREKAIETDVQASAMHKAVVIAAVKDLNDNPDKYDLDASTKNIAMFRAAPFAMRKNFNIANLLVPAKNVDVMGAIKDYYGGLPTEKTTTAKTVNGVLQTEEVDSKPGFDDVNDPAVFENNVQVMAYSSKASKTLKNAWDLTPLTEKDAYIKQAMAQTGDATQAPTRAYELWVTDQAKKFAVINKNTTIHGETEASKQAAKAKAANSQYSQIPHLLASVFVGDPSMMSLVPYTPPLRVNKDKDKTETVPKTVMVYGATALNTINLGKTLVKVADAETGSDYKEVDNHPTMVTYDKTGRVYMATVESENKYQQGLQKSPFIGTGFANMKEALYYIGNTIQKSGKEEGLDPLKGIMEEVTRLNAWKDGGVDAYLINPLSGEAKSKRELKMGGKVTFPELPNVETGVVGATGGTGGTSANDPLGIR